MLSSSTGPLSRKGRSHMSLGSVYLPTRRPRRTTPLEEGKNSDRPGLRGPWVPDPTPFHWNTHLPLPLSHQSALSLKQSGFPNRSSTFLRSQVRAPHPPSARTFDRHVPPSFFLVAVRREVWTFTAKLCVVEECLAFARKTSVRAKRCGRGATGLEIA